MDTYEGLVEWVKHAVRALEEGAEYEVAAHHLRCGLELVQEVNTAHAPQEKEYYALRALYVGGERILSLIERTPAVDMYLFDHSRRWAPDALILQLMQECPERLHRTQEKEMRYTLDMTRTRSVYGKDKQYLVEHKSAALWWYGEEVEERELTQYSIVRYLDFEAEEVPPSIADGGWYFKKGYS